MRTYSPVREDDDIVLSEEEGSSNLLPGECCPGVVVIDFGTPFPNFGLAVNGVAADFQYVSIAPPISSFIRSKGDTTQTSKAICWTV